MPSQQEYLLETKNLGISFGGLKAVQNVNLRVKKGALYGLIGPREKPPFSTCLRAFISPPRANFISTAKL